MTVFGFIVVNGTPLLQPAFPGHLQFSPSSTLQVNYQISDCSQREEATLPLCMLFSMSKMYFPNFLKPDNAIFPLAQITYSQWNFPESVRQNYDPFLYIFGIWMCLIINKDIYYGGISSLHWKSVFPLFIPVSLSPHSRQSLSLLFCLSRISYKWNCTVYSLF